MFPTLRIVIAGTFLGLVLAAQATAEATVVFHRGSTIAAPENTLMAMQWAVDAGAAVIEVDLRVSADEHIVVMHDRSVQRTTNGEGEVHRMTLASLRKLDAGRGELVPTLPEVLDFVRLQDVRLVLDVKDPDRVDVDELLASIERNDVTGKVVIGSRSIRFISEIQNSAPAIDLLAFAPDKASIYEFLALDVEIVRLWSSWIDQSPELVGLAQNSGSAVWVNVRYLEGSQLERIVGAGVDGVITDRPVEALSYLSSGRVIATD